jgi:hypothetical protein
MKVIAGCGPVAEALGNSPLRVIFGLGRAQLRGPLYLGLPGMSEVP